MKPDINVTPLIDVLLVLLIIFMVISPLKPAQFEAKIPSNIDNEDISPNPHTLIVKINTDYTLELNKEDDMGTINEPQKLSNRLKQIFMTRFDNGILNEHLSNRDDLSQKEKTQKTVFIKAPKSITYGKIIKVIDEIKLVGANPISLQIDDLE